MPCCHRTLAKLQFSSSKKKKKKKKTSNSDFCVCTKTVTCHIQMSYQQIFRSSSPALAFPCSKARNITTASFLLPNTTRTALSKAWSHLFSRTLSLFFLSSRLFQNFTQRPLKVSKPNTEDCPTTVASTESRTKTVAGRTVRRRVEPTGKAPSTQEPIKLIPLSDSLSSLPKSTSSRWTSQKHRLQIRCQALRPSNSLVGKHEGRGQENAAKSMRKIKPDRQNKHQQILIVGSYETFVVDCQTSFISYGQNLE